MILSATGHRPDKLGGYRPKVFIRLVSVAEQGLQRFLPEEVIVGMALGWDQAVAQACINLGVPFRAYIPCVGQDRMWPDSSKTEYKRLLSYAKSERVFAQNYNPTCMQQRNMGMVNDSDEVMALWNGTAGGTQNCVKYADRMGKPIHNLWSLFQ